MRFGCCVKDRADIDLLTQAGYDFCELPAAAVLPLEDEQAALPALRQIAAAPLRPESFNVLVPATLPLVGPHSDRVALQTYLRCAFTRMVQLGGVIAVLGSGAARRIPNDLPRREALNQLAEAVQIIAGEAERAGIELALEHLNQGECNVWTSISECQSFISERKLQGVRLLADLYHLEVEKEPLAHVQQAAALLAHVHVADTGRRAPGTGTYPLQPFMAVLHMSGYDRRISVECSWEDLATQASPALDFMRRSWQAVQAGAV